MAGNLSFILQIPSYIWMLCFLIGLILCVVETFMPGFGVCGISGVILLIIGIILKARSVTEALLLFIGMIVVTGLVLAFSFRSAASGRLSRSPLILKSSTTREDGYIGVEDMSFYLGKTGTTVTALRPAGTCEFGGVRLDVVSEGDFILPHTGVKVTKVEGRRVVVEAVVGAQAQS